MWIIFKFLIHAVLKKMSPLKFCICVLGIPIKEDKCASDYFFFAKCQDL